MTTSPADTPDAKVEPTHCFLCGDKFSATVRQDTHDPKNCTGCLRDRHRGYKGN